MEARSGERSRDDARPLGGDGDETFYTLDNYRAPFFLDGRLWLFYEGVTSLDARTGKEGIREKFRVNEEGLALTEADPVVDGRHIYVSGRGRVRAISRETGREVWEAKDLGLTPEMILAGGLLFVRTGGQFTGLKDGEVVERGPYGVSAIDPSSGKNTLALSRRRQGHHERRAGRRLDRARRRPRRVDRDRRVERQGGQTSEAPH